MSLNHYEASPQRHPSGQVFEVILFPVAGHPQPRNRPSSSLHRCFRL